MPTSTRRMPDGRAVTSVHRQLGRLAVRRYGLCAALVLVLTAGNLLAGLGSAGINDSDEARYGVSAYEMLQNRSFLVTTYAGEREYWNLKPPLGYWMIALSFWVLGPTPFALRLPSALCALAAVAVSMALAEQWIGRREALLTGLMMATCFGFLSHHGARSGDLDAALTLLLLLGLWQVSKLAESPWRVVGLAALLSLGFLLKSFAILPLLLVAALYALSSGSWRRLRPLPSLTAVVVFAVPVAAWALARWHADGSPEFLLRLVQEDLLDRSRRVIDHVSYSPFGFVEGLFDRFAPWPFFVLVSLLLGLRRAGGRRLAVLRRMRRDGLALVLLWALVPLTLFSIARTQHHWYLDPSYPAWAMLGALAVLDFVRRAPAARRQAVLAACLVAPLVLCEARIAYRCLIADRMPDAQRTLASLAAHRLELGPDLRTSPLRHSERFILEVMDGFEVQEVMADTRSSPLSSDRPSVLIAKGSPASRPQPSLGSGVFLDTADYLLYQSASQIAGRTGPPRRPEHGRVWRRRVPGGRGPRWRPRSRGMPA